MSRFAYLMMTLAFIGAVIGSIRKDRIINNLRKQIETCHCAKNEVEK